MRKFNTKVLLPLFAVLLVATGCYYEPVNIQGPPGQDGLAFFTVSYRHVHPYSYWDNNPSIPENPVIDEYYLTNPGIYEFEYFINPFEYWFGTYEIWINPGLPGGPHEQPGANGLDTYLMLICDPEGFREQRFDYKTDGQDNVIIEGTVDGMNIQITMQKANISERPANQPKAVWGTVDQGDMIKN